MRMSVSHGSLRFFVETVWGFPALFHAENPVILGLHRDFQHFVLHRSAQGHHRRAGARPVWCSE